MASLPHTNSLRRAESFTDKAPNRNLAAPFQHEEEVRVSTSPTKIRASELEFQFPPLEEYADVTFNKYCGPTPESNWVIPNVLLVGAYPASQDDGETFELISSILKLGITKFVCLQQEYRSHGVTEAMWRSGQALRPYFEDVRLIVKLKDTIPELNGYDIVDDTKLTFEHFPIKDCGITDDSRVLELARKLVKSITDHNVIYLHCWGGHGRTGTLVCIMLHLMYGLDPVECMRRCQFVHDLRQCPVAVSSPQTQPQRDQVTRIINRLMTQNRFLRRTLSDSSLTEPSSPTHERSPRSGHTTPIPNRTKMPSEHDHVETPESSPSKPGSGNETNGNHGGGGGVTPESAQKKEFSISASFKQLFKKTPQKSANDADNSGSTSTSATASGSAAKASPPSSNTNTGSSSGGAIESETDSNSGSGNGHVRMDVPGDNAAQGGSGSPRPPSIVQPPPSSSIFRSFRGLGNK